MRVVNFLLRLGRLEDHLDILEPQYQFQDHVGEGEFLIDIAARYQLAVYPRDNTPRIINPIDELEGPIGIARGRVSIDNSLFPTVLSTELPKKLVDNGTFDFNRYNWLQTRVLLDRATARIRQYAGEIDFANLASTRVSKFLIRHQTPPLEPGEELEMHCDEPFTIQEIDYK